MSKPDITRVARATRREVKIVIPGRHGNLTWMRFQSLRSLQTHQLIAMLANLHFEEVVYWYKSW